MTVDDGRPSVDNADGNDRFECVVVRPHHFDVLRRFMDDNFLVTEPITVSLKTQKEDVVDFFDDLVKTALDEDVSWMLVQQSSGGDAAVAAVCLNHLARFDDVGKGTVASSSQFDPFKEFDQDIQECGYAKEKANQIATFVSHIDSKLEQLLPSSSSPTDSVVLKVDVLCVAPNYRGKGLAKRLLEASVHRAREIDCDGIATVATAVASQSLFEKFGFRTLYELPFSCYRQKSRIVFDGVPDGGRSAKLQMLELSYDESTRHNRTRGNT